MAVTKTLIINKNLSSYFLLSNLNTNRSSTVNYIEIFNVCNKVKSSDIGKMQTAAAAALLPRHTNNVFNYIVTARPNIPAVVDINWINTSYTCLVCVFSENAAVFRLFCILRLERRQLQCHRDAQMLQPQRKYSLFYFKQTTYYIYIYMYNVYRRSI